MTYSYTAVARQDFYIHTTKTFISIFCWTEYSIWFLLERGFLFFILSSSKVRMINSNSQTPDIKCLSNKCIINFYLINLPKTQTSNCTNKSYTEINITDTIKTTHLSYYPLLSNWVEFLSKIYGRYLWHRSGNKWTSQQGRSYSTKNNMTFYRQHLCEISL